MKNKLLFLIALFFVNIKCLAAAAIDDRVNFPDDYLSIETLDSLLLRIDAQTPPLQDNESLDDIGIILCQHAFIQNWNNRLNNIIRIKQIDLENWLNNPDIETHLKTQISINNYVAQMKSDLLTQLHHWFQPPFIQFAKIAAIDSFNIEMAKFITNFQLKFNDFLAAQNSKPSVIPKNMDPLEFKNI